MLLKIELSEVTLVGNVLYFLEDRAQEGFIKALVNRIVQDLPLPAESLRHDIRSARGGSTVIPEFEKFMKDSIRLSPSDISLLVISIDGNCKGYNNRVRQLKKYINETHPLIDKIAFAIPDPHIERWYILDQRAFKNGVGVDSAPQMPPYKCDKEYYKNLLRQALIDCGINSLFGGSEYAENIVKSIESLESLLHQDNSFKNFVEDVKRILQH
jgi:hypothetical protein